MAADAANPPTSDSIMVTEGHSFGPGRRSGSDIDLDFWLYKYKVVLCARRDPHDWEKCVYAHQGEKARRRHPSKYQAVQCPEARAKKVCPRGEECPCTHHLFEYWLHPDRFRTCLCEHGSRCQRAICFFAHCPEEMRALPNGQTLAADMPPRKPKHHSGGTPNSTPASPTLSDYSLDPHLVHNPHAAMLLGLSQLSTSPQGSLPPGLLLGDEQVLHLLQPIRTAHAGTSPAGSVLSSEVSPNLSPRLAGMMGMGGRPAAGVPPLLPGPGYTGASTSPQGYRSTMGTGGAAGSPGMAASPGSYLSSQALQMGLMQLQLQGRSSAPASPPPGIGHAAPGQMLGAPGAIGTGFAVMDTQAVALPDMEPGGDLLSFSLWDLEGRPTAAALSGQLGLLTGMDLGALQPGMASLLLQQQQQQQAAANLQQQQHMAAAAGGITVSHGMSSPHNGADFQGFESWAGTPAVGAAGPGMPGRGVAPGPADAAGSHSITRTNSATSVTSMGMTVAPAADRPVSPPGAVERLLQQVTALQSAAGAGAASPSKWPLPEGGVTALAEDISRLLTTQDQERLLVELSKRLALAEAGSGGAAGAKSSAAAEPASTATAANSCQGAGVGF